MIHTCRKPISWEQLLKYDKKMISGNGNFYRGLYDIKFKKTIKKCPFCKEAL